MLIEPHKKEAREGGWRLEHSYAGLPTKFFTQVQPTSVTAPKLVLLNEELAKGLGLEPSVLKEHADWLSGNSLPPGAMPIAQAYAGHQFGNFVILGDGRAILLGEQITPQDARFDIQLKGSGRTRYSRGGDGRAALGPMIREYIISEAMFALKIPTTRSLAVTATGEPVFRETILPGAVLTRVAASHIRVGTFEWAAATGGPENLRTLADYTLQRHYPELTRMERPYVSLLEGVLQRQAKLVAQWQLVGFIHGVMNTDNMALSGETIDYGPCAFMDAYEPATVFSSIDRYGRYAYGNQPKIANWNLARLASAMLPLLHADEEEAIKIGNEVLGTFPQVFENHWLAGMRSKLGLFNEEPADAELIDKLLKAMHGAKADYTNVFRALSESLNCEQLSSNDDFKAWKTLWQDRLTRQQKSDQEVKKLMQQNNPAFIPRNHKVEEALVAAAQGNLEPTHILLDVFKQPFDYSRCLPEYSTPSGQPYQTFCGT